MAAKEIAKYFLLPYDNGNFLRKTGDNKVETIPQFGQDDVEGIIKDYQSRTDKFLQQSEIKAVEKAFNQAIKDYKQGFKELIDTILPQLNSEILSQILAVNNGNAVVRQGAFLSLTHKLATQYKEEFQRIEQQLEKAKEGDDIKKIVSRINGHLSAKIRGPLFENFIAFCCEQICNDIVEFTQSKGQEAEVDIEKFFTDKLGKAFSRGKNLKVTYQRDENGKETYRGFQGKYARVAGTDTPPTYEINVDGEQMSIRGGSLKSDVIIQQFFEDLTIPLGISAKMYKKGNAKIDLLKEAPLINLVHNWSGIAAERKNVALNGLSSNDISESQFNLMKQIFLIQALMGSRLNETPAQILMIMTNRKNNPIKLISVRTLLENNVFNKSHQDIDSLAKITLSLKEKKPVPRYKSYYQRFVDTAIVTVLMQKSIHQLYNLVKNK